MREETRERGSAEADGCVLTWLQSFPKVPGKAIASGKGSASAANKGDKPSTPKISLGKAGSIACLEELEEAGKKKQMAEWSSDRYAAR